MYIDLVFGKKREKLSIKNFSIDKKNLSQHFAEKQSTFKNLDFFDEGAVRSIWMQ